MPLWTTAKGNITAWPAARGLLSAAARGSEQPRQTRSQRRRYFRLCFKLTAAFQRALRPLLPDEGDTALLFLTCPVTSSTATSAPGLPRHPPPCRWAPPLLHSAGPGSEGGGGGHAGCSPGWRGWGLPWACGGWAVVAREALWPSEPQQCFVLGCVLVHLEQKPLHSLGGRKMKVVSPSMRCSGAGGGRREHTQAHWAVSRPRPREPPGAP